MSSQYKAAIFGDAHFQSPDSQPQVVSGMLDFCEEAGCEIICSNGDFADKSSLDRAETDVLNRMRSLSWLGEFVMADGNHDPDDLTVVLDMGNIRLVNDLTFEVGGKTFYIAHGHRSDDSLRKKDKWYIPWLVSLYPLVNRREWFYHNFVYEGRVPFLGRIFPGLKEIWKRRCERIAQNGLRLGIEKGADVVIFNHTHRPLFRRNGKVVYYNAGYACEWCPTSPRKSSMLTIDYNGHVEHHFFSVYGEHLGTVDLAA